MALLQLSEAGEQVEMPAIGDKAAVTCIHGGCNDADVIPENVSQPKHLLHVSVV